MWFIGAVIGLALGAVADHGMWFFGALLGGLVGWALRQSMNKGKATNPPAADSVLAARQDVDALAERVAKLETEIVILRKNNQGMAPAAPAGADLQSAPTAVEPSLVPSAQEGFRISPADPQALGMSSAAQVSRAAPRAGPTTVSATGPGDPSTGSEEAAPSAARRTVVVGSIDEKIRAVIGWFSGGNTVVRVGIVILFFGIAFLLKYAYEHTRVPIELRLAGVLAGGVALLGIGWRLRITRPGYALALQGGGIGVLYLTIFAAFRLYQILPPVPAFGFLVAIAVFSAILAITQNSLSLAVLGASGGFLAPLLASTGAGSHVLLFSYYLVLNLGIAAVAWFQSWRALNLLGFLFTFVIGWLWGARFFQPELLASTEPFLILHFLLYAAVPLLYARHQVREAAQTPSGAPTLIFRDLEIKHYVDATLVFGVPLVAFGLQTALVRGIEFGAAWSALGLAVFYLGLAYTVWRRAGLPLRMLPESYLALGTAFATLAVPLAFEGRLTSAIWALEGAAIVWIAVRQSRTLALAFGVFLQFAAGLAFLLDANLPLVPTLSDAAIVIDDGSTTGASSIPVLNAIFLAGTFVAAGGLFCSAYVSRHGRAFTSQAIGASSVQALVAGLLVWGALWWAGSGLNEIRRFVAPGFCNYAALVFLTLSGLAFSELSRRLDWSVARWPAHAIVPVMLLALADILVPGPTPLGVANWITWPFVVVWHLGVFVPAMFPVVAAGAASAAHPLAAYGWIAWPLAFGIHLVVRARHDAEHPRVAAWLHGVGLWIFTVIVSWEMSWWLNEAVKGHAVWSLITWAVVPAIVLAGLSTDVLRARWPVTTQPASYLGFGAAPIALYLIAWTLYANFTSDGNPDPLPYLPLLTPLDVAQLAVFVLIPYWLRVARSVGLLTSLFSDVRWLYALFGGTAFIWANGVLLRTLHHWAGVPFRLDLMLRSVLVQTAFSIFWTVLALAAMAFATRRSLRALWFAGAALMTVVVAKLFLVDLSNIGGVERIVSFIGVGILMLVIGYFAPVPPKAERSRSAATPEAL